MAKVKKDIISYIFIMIGFVVTGCDKQSDTNDTKKPSIVWVKPTEAVCKANGGEIFLGECQAEWKDAPKICEAFGAKLPTLNELKSAMTECGGVLNTHDKNENNQVYQECYKKSGFDEHRWYWSITENDSMTGANLNFKTGNDYPHVKSSPMGIMCIDVNSSKN